MSLEANQMEVVEERDEALIMVDETAIYESGSKRTNKPQSAKRDESNEPTDYKIANWGDNNDWPQLVDKDLETNTDLWRSLDMNARALYGGGVEYEVYNLETGETSKKKIFEIEQFLFQNAKYPLQATGDFYKYANVFPEIIVNKPKTKIFWLSSHPAGHCRYELQDKSGIINNCYINANWGDQANWDDKLTLKRPVLDPWVDMPENLADKSEGPRFIYPLSFPSGKSYYQLPIWNGIRNNGWLKLANDIPKLKAAVMKNQMTIKYHIKFPDYYWSWKYPDWDGLDSKKKKALKKAEFDAIKKWLSGAENAGKSIATGYKTDPDTLKAYPGVEIIPIDDKLKQGIYIEDSTEASIKLFAAAGIDPSLFGFQLGGKGSNLSGSDKREAYNIFVSFMKPYQDIILRPYDFISWFNGWNNRKELIIWKFSRSFMQMLNAVTPSQRETKSQNDEPTD